MERVRCSWVGSDPAMMAYHDTEWGVPCHDDRKLFQYIILDTFQAGLSWAIMIKKREGFRRAFADFDPVKIAEFVGSDVERLLANPEIIRNRQKVMAAITNAKAYLAVQQEHGSFDKYIWKFVSSQPIQNNFERDVDIPSSTTLSDKVSEDLRQRGFKFVGTTIVYAFMQGAGLLNDHTVNCFRHDQVAVKI